MNTLNVNKKEWNRSTQTSNKISNKKNMNILQKYITY